MLRIGRSIAYALLAVAFAAPCFADKLVVVPASEASKESFQVNKRIPWHTNLDQAKEEASKNGKLIFWVHMLGSMDGKT